MSVREDLGQLSIALHRKLLLVNADLRAERQKKHCNQAVLSKLKSVSKSLDNAYSQSLNALKQPDEVKITESLEALSIIYKQA